LHRNITSVKSHAAVRPVTLLPVWGLVHQPVQAAERRASRLLVAVAAAVRSAWRAPVALVALVVPACPSVREHPVLVLVVAVAAARQPAVLVAPLVRLHPLAVPVVQAAVVAARICCWRHGSRVVRRRAPGWLTVAG
jgi:hypothetical protein